jgi:predicted CXXCH cytochrome family protein
VSTVSARLERLGASLGRRGLRLPHLPRLPLSPRSIAGSVLRIAIAAGVIAVTLSVTVGALTFLNDQYASHPERNAAEWAGLTSSYADASECERCHSAQYGAWQLSQHHESCHGPLAAHVAAASAGAPWAIAIATPSTPLCVTCHRRVEARPSAFPQVVLAAHYDLMGCTECHDPHSTQGTRPPAVGHSLARLPECLACHGPKGMRPFPAGHAESSDAICLRCHAAGQ